MKINTKKPKFMVFNPGTSRDFMPKFIMDGNEIEVVEETRLLGVVVRSDLTWSSNTDDVVKRANNKLWCLRRLKNRGVETSDLLDVYTETSQEHTGVCCSSMLLLYQWRGQIEDRTSTEICIAHHTG